MNTYELIDHKTKVTDICCQTIQILEENAFNDIANKCKSEVKKQLDKVSPSIMFYGVYNAGKSSIINALTGEYTAKVGDVPTTATIQHINWNGFTLVDTPGIVANDDHTNIAEDEIKRNDVILFVVDEQGTFENIAVATAIVKIIKIGKPILVVVNQKQFEDEGVYTTNIRDVVIGKIYENITKVGNQLNISDAIKFKNFCGIIPVNAATAFTGKTEYKSNDKIYNLMMQKSGIEELVIAIQKKLNEYDGMKMLLPAVDIIIDTITQTQQALQKKSISDIEKLYYQTINEINQQKNQMYKYIITLGKNEILSCSDQLYAFVIQGSNNNNELINQLNSKLSDIIYTSFKNVNLALESKIELYLSNINDSISIGTFDIPEIKLELPPSTDADRSGVFDLFKYSSLISTITKLPKNNFIMPIPMLPIPGLSEAGVLITLMNGIVNLFKNKNNLEEDKQKLQNSLNEQNRKIAGAVNAKMAAILEVNNKIRTEMYKLEESFVNTAENLIEDSFYTLQKKIDTEFQKESTESIQVENSIQSLARLLGDCEKFKVIISNDSV